MESKKQSLRRPKNSPPLLASFYQRIYGKLDTDLTAAGVDTSDQTVRDAIAGGVEHILNSAFHFQKHEHYMSVQLRTGDLYRTEGMKGLTPYNLFKINDRREDIL